ncbi:tetratricopeptide repeat protein 33 [Rhinoderma darwinii]|uniref:tetratricopeptide repeat protein 33 n=1 Tax=Rhinoderma darwinii TaxID=43563 RepID=UPI003F661DD6
MASFGWKRKIGERVSKVTSQNFEKESADEAAGVESDDVDWLHSIKRKKGLLLEDNISKSKRLKEEGALLALNGRHSEAIKKWDEGIHLTPEDAPLYEMKAQSLLSLQEIFPAVQAAQTAVSRNPKFVEAWQTLGRAQLGLGEIAMAVYQNDRRNDRGKRWNEEGKQGLCIVIRRGEGGREKLMELILPEGKGCGEANGTSPTSGEGDPKKLMELILLDRKGIGIHICPSNVELWDEDLNWARKLLHQKKEAGAAEALERNQTDFSIEQALIPDYDFESDEVVAACDAISRIQKVASANSKTIVVSSSGKVTNQEPTKDNASTSEDSKLFIKAR